MNITMSKDYEAYLCREMERLTPEAEKRVRAAKTEIGQLATLVKIEGALKVITDLRDPVSGMLLTHEVTQITGPTFEGAFVARTREGDYVRGFAPSLLARLTEAGRIGVVYRTAVRDGLLNEKEQAPAGPNDGVMLAQTMRATARPSNIVVQTD